ncbi:hypothetical protein E2C01_047783 [Portunus trituberculatus]|uniref:Uncharacterized protein n=1 Tax=Portunus trituberculatus TaxID=210409 RepID=A0A5B7G1G8_PORTR|nr:hypothetical protein [Portunus trituberculatus]
MDRDGHTPFKNGFLMGRELWNSIVVDEVEVEEAEIQYPLMSSKRAQSGGAGGMTSSMSPPRHSQY